MKSNRLSTAGLGSLALLLAVAAGPVAGADELPRPQPHTGWSFKEAGMIPVQSGGRLKPLDSLAREMVLFETGSRKFDNWDPVDLLMSWLSDPASWENETFVQVTRQDVKRQLGMEEARMRFSPRELFHDSFLIQYAEELQHKTPGTVPIQGAVTATGGMRQDPREQELKRLLERIGAFRNVVSGEAWTVIPVAPPAQWKTLAGNDVEGEPIRVAYARMVRAYKAGDQENFEKLSVDARQAVQAKITGWDGGLDRVNQMEYIYNHNHPFMWAWIFMALSSILWLVSTSAAPAVANVAKKIAVPSTIIGFIALVGGIAFRCWIAGRPPVTNMYESIIWVSLGIFVFASIIYFRQRQPVLFVVACALCAFGLIAADSAPAMMDPGIHPLVPVLRSNYWLTIHVLTITLGYAAFALTLGIGNVTLAQYFRDGGRAPGASARIQTLNQLTYRAMQFGIVLLAAGTILGGVWADYSWGRFWGWDPKEVWALTALLTYLVILHARYTGWMGQFGYAAWTVVAFTSVVMAWYGVNFVLGVGLHSYGFAAGGRGWVAAFVGVQLGYVIVSAILHRYQQHKRALAAA